MDLEYFEDIAVGEAPLSGTYEVSKEEVIDFATQFDPQPFHLDEEAAKKTMLGGLSASGWHTASMSMRLLYDSYLVRAASMGSPGVDELKWIKPVRPGDRLRLRRNVLEKRQSQSRPDMGLALCQCDVFNQHDDVVMTYRSPIMLRRRNVQAAAAEPQPPRQDAAKPAAAKPEVVKPDAAEPAPSDVAEAPFAGLFYDDIAVGQRMEIGSYSFDKAAIIAFAKKYDPQPFHLDEAAAQKSHFGGLVASGWHTAAAYMGQLIRNRQKRQAEFVAKGVLLPEPGPSPGFNKLRWRAPVFAGDTLRFTSEIVNKRQVSRPGWGLVFVHNRGFNQHGRLAFEFEAIAFWQMRP